MLSTIRSKATGLISYILIGAICLSFALWGINSYFEGASQIDVATVNGDEISFENYQNQLRNQQQQMRQMFQNNLPEDYFDTPGFKRQAVDQLVNELLLNQTINERGYTLGDEALAEQITSNQAFFTDGKFDDERYRRLLVSNNWTVQTFEATQRRQGAYSQIQQALGESFYIDDMELNEILALQKQKRIAQYFLVENSSFEPEVSDEEINEQYEAFPDLYKTEDQIKIDYLDLSVNALKQDSISDDEVKQYYDDNKTEFSKPETRTASHILIKPDSDSQQDDEQALKKANDLLAKLNSGEDFAEIAKIESDDKGSANNGGDLGVITPGVMVKEFEESVFSLGPDEISQPVKTEFGYHLIKLNELVGETISPFEEVKEEISSQLIENKAIEEFVEKAETFKNLAFENPNDLEPIADQLGLEIQLSDWITRGDAAGIASNPLVRDAAFNAAVLDENLNSDVIEIDENSLMILRKNEYEEAVVKPLDEVKEQITVLLKSRKAQEMAQEHGEALQEKIQNAPDSWEQVIKAEDLTGIDLADTRDGAQTGDEQAISKVVFEKPRPQEGVAIIDGLSLGSGYAVYRLEDVEDIDASALADIEQEERDALLASLQQRFGGETASNVLESLRENAKIQIFEENLDLTPEAVHSYN